MDGQEPHFVPVVSTSQLNESGCVAVQLNGHTIALFKNGDDVSAIDNRCPHMGFPLDKGTVNDGILTCHWHHARFDLESGGTFDPWADDVRTFPTEIRDGTVWVDVGPQVDRMKRVQDRLEVGLERNLSLVIGKSVLALLDPDGDPVIPLRAGLEFGTHNRRAGWGQGLTILACLMNILPELDDADRPRALYHGLAAVAADTAGAPARFPIRPLPGPTADLRTLKRWFRQFVEVRDDEGAERCIASAVRAGATDRDMADMLFVAATDHRYIQTGHVLDFTNKAFEALDWAGWDLAETVLTSLVRGYTAAERMEEVNEWRHPVDLVAILEETFDKLPDAVVAGMAAPNSGESMEIADTLERLLLGDDPVASAEALLQALAQGVSWTDLASAVTQAAAQRIARFHTSNEFSDWDTALHTYTFANAVEQGMHRAPSQELLRGVFDAAMSVYLDRFLNIPAAKLPQSSGDDHSMDTLLDGLPIMLDSRHQVNKAGGLVAEYLDGDGDLGRLLAMLGKLLLREDRDFHTIQTIEAAVKQSTHILDRPKDGSNLVAATRYLAAHSPTVRAQGQTYQIAYRLHRGEKLFEGE